MQKRFCDICSEEVTNVKMLAHVAMDMQGAEVRGLSAEMAYTMSVHFGIWNHPTGFGGPPDLCKRHKLIMIDLLRKAIEEEE